MKTGEENLHLKLLKYFVKKLLHLIFRYAAVECS